MEARRFVVCILFFSTWCGLYAQPESKKREKNPEVHTQWYIAGFDYTFSYWGLAQSENHPMVKFFDGISQSPQAREQFDFDFTTTKGFRRHYFSISGNNIIEGNAEIIIKRKVKNPNSIINFIEGKAGAAITQHTCYLDMYGDSIVGDTISYEFKSNYFMQASVIKATFALQLKTPQVFGFLSLYAGIMGYFGEVYDMPSWTGPSTLETTKLKGNNSSSATYYNSGHADFTSPNLVAGVYFPLGLRIAFTPHTSLKIGYTRAFNSYYMKSKTSRGEYVGLNFSINKTINDNGKKIESTYYPASRFFWRNKIFSVF